MILIKKLNIVFNSFLRSLFCVLLLSALYKQNRGGASLWKTLLSLVLRVPAYKEKHFATSFTPANAYTTELGLLLSKLYWVSTLFTPKQLVIKKIKKITENQNYIP